jgi:hypothetical protein
MATKEQIEKEKRKKKILSKFSKADIKRLERATKNEDLNKKLMAAFNKGNDSEVTKIAADINRLVKQEEDYFRTKDKAQAKYKKGKPISEKKKKKFVKLGKAAEKEGAATYNLIAQYGSEGRKSRAMGRKEQLSKFKQAEEDYAGGGYVKKYANGGGIRKPRYSA